jgi:hypothetical protein
MLAVVVRRCRWEILFGNYVQQKDIRAILSAETVRGTNRSSMLFQLLMTTYTGLQCSVRVYYAILSQTGFESS